MVKKYVVLKTTSTEKFNEISPHFSKYNIDCFNQAPSFSEPIAILKEHSELTEHVDGTATVTSSLIVENKDSVTQKIYISKAHGFLSTDECNEEPKPWGYDAKFIPDGIMTSYYHLKKKGLKISPRDINIGYFLQDFVHYSPSNWAFKELKINRPVDLEVDYRKILFDFFDMESQKNFIGYDFWSNIITSATSSGLFIRESNTRKMNNYWWPVGNAGLPMTNKSDDHMHEKTYMMHDIFHYLIPDLLYTGNTQNIENYEWSYTLHRVMTECFTLVLADMFYVHYATINGLPYKTMKKRHIYPIFEGIYREKTDVFTYDILKEVVRASCIYGLKGDESGFISLFVKYNGCYKLDKFRTLLKDFREKYDYYLVQDLKWTIHNASYMKAHSYKYGYMNNLPSIVNRLDIIKLDSLALSPKQNIDYFIEIGLKQLNTALRKGKQPDNTIIKNKFSRWVMGQLCFFEHYASIPIVDGYKSKFYSMMNDNISKTINKIRNFRYEWDYLMDKSTEIQIITMEESKQYKEVFPIFDAHYISSYEDKTENHTEVMTNFLNNFEF
jgi:hypothetical protein